MYGDHEDGPATGTMMVLCLFRVWSAYKELGHADGAKMIHVNSVKDIPTEFDLQMSKEMKRGHKFLGIQAPSKFVMTGYRPYCGLEKF